MLSQLTHVGIAVRELDTAIETWTHQLGLELQHRLTVESQGFDVEFIAALEPSDETNQLVRFLAKHGEGLFHLAAVVADIHDAEHELAAPDLVAVTVGPSELGPSVIELVDPNADRVVVSPRSANGVLVELLQARPPTPEPRPQPLAGCG
jgi:methylmalonyl-CoA/ethylmalonyl-CoA epimerase